MNITRVLKSLGLVLMLHYSIMPAMAFETLQEYVSKNNLKMELVGDGKNTLKSTLILTDPKTGHSISTELNTFCVSKKHLLPPATREDVLKRKLTYSLSPAKEGAFINLLEAAKRLNSEGSFNNLPISSERRVNTISQLSIWQKIGGKGLSPDGINLKSIESDVLDKANNATHTLTSQEKSILRKRIDLICGAIEKTRKLADSFPIEKRADSTDSENSGKFLIKLGSILVPSDPNTYQDMMISEDTVVTVPYLKIATTTSSTVFEKDKKLEKPDDRKQDGSDSDSNDGHSDEDGNETDEHQENPGGHTQGRPTTNLVNCPAPIGVLLESRDETFIPENGNQTWATAQIYEKVADEWVKSERTDKLTFRFYLNHVSKEKGECLNSGDKTTVDLFFDQALNPNFDCAKDYENHPTSATTKSEVNNTKVILKCEDFGAYSQVEVVGEKSIQLVRYAGVVTDKIKNPEDVSKTIPPDEKPNSESWELRNHISDAYEKKVGMSPDAKLDDETVPESDPRKPGDGYSAYEEYRGFRVKGEKDKPSPHVRTSWKEKQLFYYNPDSINMSNYEKATGIKLFRLDLGQFIFDDAPPDDKTLPEEGSSIFVNFNHGFSHLVDQHGVSIKYGKLTSSIKLSPEQEKQFGTVGTLAKTVRLKKNAGFMGPPKNHSCIIVDRNNIARLFEINKSDFGELTAEASIEKYASHEFSHASCLLHHGEFGRKQKKDETGAEVFDDNNRPVMTVDFGDEESKPGNLIIQKGGPASGNFDCLMRYKAWKSSVVKNDDGTYEDVDTRLGKMDSLCTSPDGTGPNENNKQAGNATRGDCRHQLNVNDVYEGNK